MISDNDWTEYRALVLSELKRLDQHISECDDNMREQVGLAKKELAEEISKLSQEQILIDREVRKMKTQAMTWGAIAVVLINALTEYL